MRNVGCIYPPVFLALAVVCVLSIGGALMSAPSALASDPRAVTSLGFFAGVFIAALVSALIILRMIVSQSKVS